MAACNEALFVQLVYVPSDHSDCKTVASSINASPELLLPKTASAAIAHRVHCKQLGEAGQTL